MSDTDSTPISDTEEALAETAEAKKAKRNGVAAQTAGADVAAAAQEAAADTAAATTGGAADRAGSAAQRAGLAAQRAGEVFSDVAGDVASTVSKKAPVLIDASRTGAGIAAREVQGASSENLMLGTVFSTGLALGLVLARVPRPLSVLALVPVFAMGGTLLGRRAGIGPASSPKRPGSARSKGTPS